MTTTDDYIDCDEPPQSDTSDCQCFEGQYVDACPSDRCTLNDQNQCVAFDDGNVVVSDDNSGSDDSDSNDNAGFNDKDLTEGALVSEKGTAMGLIGLLCSVALLLCLVVIGAAICHRRRNKAKYYGA